MVWKRSNFFVWKKEPHLVFKNRNFIFQNQNSENQRGVRLHTEWIYSCVLQSQFLHRYIRENVSVVLLATGIRSHLSYEPIFIKWEECFWECELLLSLQMCIWFCCCKTHTCKFEISLDENLVNIDPIVRNSSRKYWLRFFREKKSH